MIFLGLLGVTFYLSLLEPPHENHSVNQKATLALESAEFVQPTEQQLEEARKHPDLQETEWEISEQDLEEVNEDLPPEAFEEVALAPLDVFLDSVDQYGAYETMEDHRDLPEEFIEDLKAQGIDPRDMILMGASEDP